MPRWSCATTCGSWSIPGRRNEPNSRPQATWSRPPPPAPPPPWLVERLRLPALAAELNALVARYARFANREPGDPLDALVLRLLLVHDWRRTLLHTPVLPPALQPTDWPLAHARRCVAALYLELLPASARWLDLCAAASPFADDESVRRRFGGLACDESIHE